MNTREQRIGEIMESLDGMHRAQGDPLLHEKVEARLGKSGRTAFLPATGLLLKIAAGLALLISVNVISVVYYTRSASAETSSNPVATGYFSYIKTITPEL
jgi:hypothetical protein